MSPPSQVQQGTAPEDIYDWVHIDDFSPGIWSNSNISMADPNLSAPLGAAHPDNTWGCAALPGGGLGPLPLAQPQPFIDADFPGTSTVVLRSGFICNPGLFGSGFNELIILGEADDGTHHFVQAVSAIPQTLGITTITPPTATNTTTPGFFGAPYPTWTRMSASGASPWPPVLVFPGSVATDASGVNGHLWVYPELASPSSYVAQDLITAGSSFAGQVICYGSRVIVLVGVSYTHPGLNINTNENINFTDPPLSSIYLNQNSVVGAEEPWGYGAWGSVSVGELLLIKKVGGAVIVYGDIDAPSATINVPGVTPTGGFVGSAAATPAGLFYCSENRGAWVWNGGNTSQKISQRLDDDFFDLGIEGTLGTNNYGFFCYPWQKYVLFSNNYMYDTENGAWWILTPQLTQSIGATALKQMQLFWYSQGAGGGLMFAAPLQCRKGHNDPYWVLFDNSFPTWAWSWQSVPIDVVEHSDRTLDVRQVVIVASAPDGDSTNTVTVTIGGFSETSTVTISSEPTALRFNVGAGAQGLEKIEITVLGFNHSTDFSAPILHSIDIGYQVRQKAKVTN